jgi:hypothetical protein
MTRCVLIASLFLGAFALGAAPASAQHRGGGVAVGHAVARPVLPSRVIGPRFVGLAPFYRPYFYPGFAFGLYAGYPYYYPYGYYGWGYPYYGYPYAYPGYYAAAYRPYGGVRIQGAPRDAQVYADGYYVGIVDNFDGALQHLNLEPGPHKIEIRVANQPPIAFEVNVRPGETITYRASAR